MLCILPLISILLLVSAILRLEKPCNDKIIHSIFFCFLQVQQTTIKTVRASALLYNWVTQSVRSSVTLLLSNNQHKHQPSVCIHNKGHTDNSILIRDKCRHPVSLLRANPVRCTLGTYRLSHTPGREFRLKVFIPQFLRDHLLFMRAAWGGHVINNKTRRKMISLLKTNRLLLLPSLPRLPLHTLFRFSVALLSLYSTFHLQFGSLLCHH